MKRAIVSGSARPGITRPSADCAASSRSPSSMNSMRIARVCGLLCRISASRVPSISGSAACATIAAGLSASAISSAAAPWLATRTSIPSERHAVAILRAALGVAVGDQHHGRHQPSLGTRSSRWSRNASDSASERSLEWNQRTRPGSVVGVRDQHVRRPVAELHRERRPGHRVGGQPGDALLGHADPERIREHDEVGVARRVGAPAQALGERVREQRAGPAEHQVALARPASDLADREPEQRRDRRRRLALAALDQARERVADRQRREPPLALARAAVLGRRAARARATAPRAGWRRRDS